MRPAPDSLRHPRLARWSGRIEAVSGATQTPCPMATLRSASGGAREDRTGNGAVPAVQAGVSGS